MTKTEKGILFADSLPDGHDYNDDVYDYFENEFIKNGNLTEIIEAIKAALIMGVVDDLSQVIYIYKG